MAALDFYYDIASPYSYIAAARLEPLAAAAGVTVNWRPFLLGGVFAATGNKMPAAVPARGRYLFADLLRWSKKHGIPFRFSSSFPHNSLVAMRALTAADDSERVAATHALFRAAWVEDRNVSKPEVVAEALGARGAALVEAAGDAAVKERLKATTQAAIDAGAFGAPSFVVGGVLLWGNDRLEWAIEEAANAAASSATSSA